ncbi:acyl-CoA dehydrogenase family protein [Heliophilum fasciatum]|uniref:Butyryl-CoA dehydrogenase/acyl-CoA dehydrogenase n=1 Tax=Heliophilum fasciatum TaxID=35700 RepID=A0A4R2RLZ7_9FIRM|nr:acyl-CoA dehydrogenase family protein [Heliophilum fasciatum]MCW2278185.1 alkylation response protein AidB-like acyl-CoA dehydrogenase [Heliophilum fasciatum]TCP63994.1 butyryl-CoA dehydrogenase/acyl-CoA dehydrogenase [Heliophilum fasciatum]
MNLLLTEEQLALRDLAHDFAAHEIRPYAPDWDEKESFPRSELAQKAVEVGLWNIAVPEAHGGTDIDAVSTCLINEELAWGCAGIATSIGGNSLGSYPLLIAGTDEQKERFLRPQVEAGAMAAFALTEPNAGSDVASLATTAHREGDEYVLQGRKCFITNGDLADVYVVFAATDRSQGAKGLSTFVVERGTAGLSTGKKEKKMGIRASNTTEVILEEVRVPAANRLGAEGDGFKLAMKTLDISRPSVAAMAVGVARAAYETALHYAKERVQFGKPIASFQAIQTILADMAMAIETARLLTLKAAMLKDQGLPYTLESAMCKAYATDVAMKVTTDAVQVLGGYGYSREYPVEKWMRDAKILQIYEGTNQIQRLVIANQILR